MKSFIRLFIAAILSINVVFASPGMRNYKLSEARKIQIRKVQKSAEQAKEELITQMESTIDALNNDPQKDNVNTAMLTKISKEHEKEFNKRKKLVHSLLKDYKKFTLAFNQAVALEPGLTPFSFKQSLLKSIDVKESERSLSKVKDDLQRHQKLSSYLRDVLVAVKNDTLDLFVNTPTKKPGPSRSVAQLMIAAPPLAFFTILAIGAVILVGSIITGAYLIGAGSVALGMGLVFWPLGVIVLGGIVLFI